MTSPRVEHLAEGVELWLGDARDLLEKVPADSCVVSDPPYGIAFKYDVYDDSRENLKGLSRDVFEPLIARCRRTAILCGTTQMFVYPPPDWVMSIDWETTGSFGLYGYSQWMPVLLYGKDLPGFGNVNNGILKSDRIPILGGGGVGFQRREKIAHPCPKPENLMRRVLARLTSASELIVDPFLGSGTTGVSAVALGRRFMGFEISPAYFDEACRRVEAEIGRPRLFAEPVFKPEQVPLFPNQERGAA